MTLRRLCSKTFRSAIENQYVGLGSNPNYWRHMARLLFNYNEDGIAISQLHVAYDFEVMDLYFNGRLNAGFYISDFRSNVFSYELVDYDFKNHQCRYAKFDLPSHIIQLLQDEYNGLFNGETRLVFVTGNCHSAKIRTQFRKEDFTMSQLLTKHSIPMNSIVDKFQLYLNDLPANRFNRICKYIPQALNALYDKDSSGNFIINPQNHQDQRNILLSLSEQPQPFYAPSKAGNTVRLFEINKGLQGIHSHLRGILTQEAIEVDIQNAHLAIVAELWHIEDVQEFLSKGNSIWSELIPAMGFEYPNKEVKTLLKDFFYGLIYGMGSRTLELGMTQVFGPTPYLRFIEHPLVKCILEARKNKLKELQGVANGKQIYKTPLGKEVKPYSYTSKEGYFESNLTSILSQEANEYEMLLIEPIIDLAIESEDFDVILYQFDGVTLQCRRKRDKRAILQKVKQVVDERAKALGVITTLTW